MRKFIFIWFLAIGAISTIGAMWTSRSIRLAAWNSYQSDLAGALEQGGLPSLKVAARHIDPQEKMKYFVFDSDMNEVSGQKWPGSVHELAGRLRAQNGAEFETLGGGLLSGSVVTSRDGRTYRLVVWLPSRRPGYVPLNAWALMARIGIFVAAAGLLCSWLAWRLSTPILQLRHAARQFASGNLAARADAPSFSAAIPEYKELASDFDEMASRIETLVDFQRRLLRDVSHELRTPLTRLTLAVNNARRAPANAIEPLLDRIDQESERLNALIERIIRLSRVESFTEPPRHDAIELADFIESIVSDAGFEAAAQSRSVTITRAETCRIAGDRELLREAIENVVRNAIRYTPENSAVIVEAHRDGPEYRIAVRDHGPGVPAAQLEAIFDPFYRFQHGSNLDGFGIGLAIARRAVALHHGTITAANLPEGGFEVTIRVPAN